MWYRVCGHIRHTAYRIRARRRPGYVFLITVLFIGAIILATTVSLLLLGWAAEQNGKTQEQATQARLNAESCIHTALQVMRNNPSLAYTGSGTITFSGYIGSCNIGVAGNGNRDRTLCAIGRSGPAVRRIAVVIVALYPLTIQSWKEVASHTLCDTAAAQASSSSS